jgi:hypothetical protein
MRWGILALFVFVVSCVALTTEPGAGPSEADHGDGTSRIRVLGSIAGYNNDDPRIDLVPGNRSVLVRVTTYGDGCHSKGETEVQVDGMEALVTPYDYTATPGTVCTQQLVSSIHETTVPFSGSGTALLRIRGLDRSRMSAQNMIGDTIVVERSVVVP